MVRTCTLLNSAYAKSAGAEMNQKGAEWDATTLTLYTHVHRYDRVCSTCSKISHKPGTRLPGTIPATLGKSQMRSSAATVCQGVVKLLSTS